VDNMARPGGNITGFINYEFPMGTKWLEVLKEIAPRISRVLVVLVAGNIGNLGFLRAIEAAAPTLDVRQVATLAQGRQGNAHEIEAAIEVFAQEPNGGLIVLPGAGLEHRNLIVELAKRHRLPAIYTLRPFIASGGLMSYDTDALDLFRRAASYVDRILRGEKPGNLPVQAPAKYELVINLKTARALGLDVPPTLLARATK
jgi:putative tryptophan/tyrosine transport system substrate-binding protein